MRPIASPVRDPRQPKAQPPIPARTRPFLLAALYVVGATAVAEALFRIFGFTRLSPVFLASVLLAATTLGARPAFLAAALAFATYNFYIVEPRFTFAFDSPEEILTLLLFLGVAFLTGGLAGRVKDEATRARARARTMGALFEASRGFSSTDSEEALRHHLAEQLAKAVKGVAEVVDDTRAYSSVAAPTAPGIEAEWSSRPLVANGVDLGLARWRAAEPTEAAGAEVEPLVQVLVDLGAAAIARSRLAAENAEIEQLARTEKLRTALLASVSHDFRTPLTAILTSATSLRAYGERFDARERDDLLSTIQEEAERINGHVANLLSFMKLESGAFQVEPHPLSINDVLGRLLKRYQPRGGGRVLQLELGRTGLHALGDFFLLEQALSNVLENAIRYSPTGSTIQLAASRTEDQVMIDVVDAGPGVPDGAEEEIFAKFYRVPGVFHHQGTGLGLSIARGMIEAMGGQIFATNRIDGTSGLRVRVNLPAAE